MPLSSPFRVLLVDDDQLDRMAVRRALVVTAPAVSIVEAESLAAGMQAMQTSPIDCLLLDYHLPDGLGLEMLVHVRNSSKSLPVIMLTAVADAQTAVELMKAGATDYIPKPLLSAERLERSLRYAMRIREADERVRRYTEQLRALSSAALRINESESVDTMLATTAEEARLLVDARYAVVTLLDDSDRANHPVAISENVSLARESNEAFASSNGSGDEASLLDTLEAPLLARDGTLIGTLSLDQKRVGEFTESDRAVVAQLAQLASGAIENAHLLETARAATRARDDMLAIVSHDLRNPVQTIAMATTLLLELPPANIPGSVTRRQMEIVLRASQRANRLIDDLLDAIRIDAGTFSIVVSAIPVATLVREAAEALSPLAQDAGITLTHEVASSMPGVMADSQRVLQVFSNIGGNAIKFTPRGGRIALTALPIDGAVSFSVTDSGCGIASNEVEHIFDRFWQGRHRAHLGAGLGLWIAKGIVEAHGGSINVVSGVSQGTTVSFTLPTE